MFNNFNINCKKSHYTFNILNQNSFNNNNDCNLKELKINLFNKENLKDFKIKFLYQEFFPPIFENFESFIMFCNEYCCDYGCFLNYLKLNNSHKNLIWKKFGLINNNDFEEIPELFYEKLFSIFKYNPCLISKCLNILNKKNKKDFNISCISVK